MILNYRRSFLLLLILLMPGLLSAQVTNDRLLHASSEPQNWLSYSGSYMSQRHSLLTQITPANVKNLEMKWVFQAIQPLTMKFEATPLVVDGIMYVTQPPNDIIALDAKTGRTFWIYHYADSPAARPCCGAANRGLAILGNTLFMGTIDAHLVAVDAINGHPLWNVKVAEASANYSITVAPLVIKDKVILGVAGGDFGVRGFIVAYDVTTGKEAWRFNTIPAPGEPGHDSWGGESWKRGGAGIWTTGSYDPDLNLTYWGTGNPNPNYDPTSRPGDNLYSESVVALDVDTGKLKWYYQFSPHDAHDFDSTQVPVLVNTTWEGSPRKLMFWANRNGFFYVLDRTTGKFISGHPFIKQTWAAGLDPVTGRPTLNPPVPSGTLVFPGPEGGTNWYSPSYSPHTGLFYIPVWDNFKAYFNPDRVSFPISGGPNPNLSRVSTVNTYTDEAGHGAVVALDPHDGTKKWKFDMYDFTLSGVLTTESDVLFVGGREGYFQALNAKTGALLWKASLGGEIAAGPMSYEVDGKQYVAIAAGNQLYVFGLRDASK